MTLVAVTKGVPVGRIRDAVALGLTELGENRVQEARAKQLVLGSGFGVLGSGQQQVARRTLWQVPRAPTPEP